MDRLNNAVVADIIFCRHCLKHHRYDERCKFDSPDNENLNVVIVALIKRKISLGKEI